LEQLTVTARDGVRLACWDFAGAGTPLLMVHGVGLHGRCWAPVADLHLAGGSRPLALDMRAHGASGRSPDGRYGWELFAADVLDGLDGLGLAAQPGGVAGVGHSAGASALLRAEADCPGSFSRIWTWEPIVSVPGSGLREQRGAEFAERARRRRSHFASVAEARAHLEGRGMFAEFCPEAFEAFLTGGLVPDDAGGVQLACRAEDEASAYAAAAERGSWARLQAARSPVAVVGGGASPALPAPELEAIAAQLPAGEAKVLPLLGHFGPFQAPAAIAADIAGWARWLPPGPGGRNAPPPPGTGRGPDGIHVPVPGAG
jgi:pimeloyl-ACP methyl ester carboxylesterase